MAQQVSGSRWASFEAVETFAGEEPEEATYLPEDERYLVDDQTVAHYRIFAST